MILASIWAFIGTGVSIAAVAYVNERYPNRYHYSTHAFGAFLVLLFWPTLIVALLSILLMRIARQ